MRGNPLRRTHELAQLGTIPACAGEPLTPARRRQIGVSSREMPLLAGDEHSGARHAWVRHGPKSQRPAWERLRWPDWLYVQRIIDEVTPVQQPSGRWRFVSGAVQAVRNRPVGCVLITEVLGDALTPVTFYRTDKIGR